MGDRAGRGGLRRSWAGAGGLAALQPTAACTSRDPAAFRARMAEATVAGTRVAEWRCTEASAQMPPSDTIVLVHVLAGTVRCLDPRNRWTASAGQLLVLGAGEARRWSFPGGAHLVSVRLPVALVPTRLLAGAGVVSGVVAPSDVTTAFVASLGPLGEAVLRSPVPSEFVGQGLRALALAVLDERQRLAGSSAGDLRERIERFVDGRLSDSELTPAAIAEAFAVSLRWVHHAFSREGETLAQYIRERRADAVADEVRRTGLAAGTGALAAAYGFSGRDHLGRVFRSRYGMTVAQFQAAVAAGAAPAPLLERQAAAG